MEIPRRLKVSDVSRVRRGSSTRVRLGFWCLLGLCLLAEGDAQSENRQTAVEPRDAEVSFPPERAQGHFDSTQDRDLESQTEHSYFSHPFARSASETASASRDAEEGEQSLPVAPPGSVAVLPRLRRKSGSRASTGPDENAAASPESDEEDADVEAASAREASETMNRLEEPGREAAEETARVLGGPGADGVQTLHLETVRESGEDAGREKKTQEKHDTEEPRDQGTETSAPVAGQEERAGDDPSARASEGVNAGTQRVLSPATAVAHGATELRSLSKRSFVSQRSRSQPLTWKSGARLAGTLTLSTAVFAVALQLVGWLVARAELQHRGRALVDAFVDAIPHRVTVPRFFLLFLRELHTPGSLVALADQVARQMYAIVCRVVRAVEKLFGAVLPRQVLIVGSAAAGLAFTFVALGLRLVTPRKFLPQVEPVVLLTGWALATAPLAILAFDLHRGAFGSRRREVVQTVWSVAQHHLALRTLSLVFFLSGSGSVKQAWGYLVMDAFLTATFVSTLLRVASSRETFQKGAGAAERRSERSARQQVRGE
ncbi:hypothetical protein TGME49_220330 [Toxoplasma gondii ME49]|uniref:Transmembrane protein n=2 Tax=Toxoplasma gondii TaxID=5811 RepID=S8FBT7_TOXGM|nr:hypothetical protein TGME49_220330 [Toxoplasma gondii ME49]EPT31133.1 hypothetical protein TGME49_220330 [Toxoplasma gondii ME49]KYF43571.1 hypothetical protein TGARI_220330 [Toxoplasma gondii ARI]|eukprot:XP_002371558.1 hypothetical protein TGME49_220330 [Toxoplasma gondii ME49]